ncbi:deoxynucleoside kinase [uncultured Clostridium sp.]|uniref:deoxynucleoside kinase n=1 Tax=uncultured Clostridium sp. TaxID=59620 RepID=UPI0025F18F39|nr:deoxynucleoside kinase [uncultured Clostridium sp.]
MVIVVGGMIGLGKSSVAKILGEHFNSEVFYESVDDNPILPLFYSESEEEIEKKRYPFLLQLYFLNTRFKSIKEALYANNNILDRSIYEDCYFARKNMELGRISELEMSIYEDLLNNMLQELEELPKKAPDLMVYLKGSFETVMNRIRLRGRDFEIDDSLKEYYEFLWKDYDNWVQNSYDASQVLIIDMDKMDVVNSEEDRKELIRLVDEKVKGIF